MQMKMSMRDSGHLTKQMEKVFTHTRTEQSMKVIGKMISNTAKELRPGRITLNMKGITSSAKSMEEVVYFIRIFIA
jgi:hypothetical protein